LQEWFQDLRDQIRHNLVYMDTGQYLPLSHRQAMADSVVIEEGENEFRLIGGPYIYTYELGRGPTVNPGDGAVRRYVMEFLEEENIQPYGNYDIPSVAYFVASKIHETGSRPYRKGEPTGVISDVINETLTKAIAAKIKDLYAVEVAGFIKKAIND
jgi:hypothetical protein